MFSSISFFPHFFHIKQEIGIQPYRKVAVVEQFFDIIYNVHVGLGGRSGRHAGQKRTYRTVNTLKYLNSRQFFFDCRFGNIFPFYCGVFVC